MPSVASLYQSITWPAPAVALRLGNGSPAQMVSLPPLIGGSGGAHPQSKSGNSISLLQSASLFSRMRVTRAPEGISVMVNVPSLLFEATLRKIWKERKKALKLHVRIA